MSDFKCIICGESWDAFRHGDMFEWEANLFKVGAGCPYCEGTSETNWKRPEPIVLWECAACGVQVETNPNVLSSCEDRLEWNLPHDAPATKWWHSHNFNKVRPTEEPAHIFDKTSNDPKAVCEFCLDHCEHCGAPISKTLECDDVYDEGWCGTPEGYNAQNSFCINCIENEFCSECGLLNDDCECECK